jgi:hypothetical protein
MLPKLKILRYPMKRLTLLNPRVAPEDIILLELVASVSNLCLPLFNLLPTIFPISSSPPLESYMSHRILNLAASYDRVNARDLQDTYMKGVYVPGDMQIQAMAKEITGNAPRADSDID